MSTPILAALVSSAPAWAAVGLAVWVQVVQRRGIKRDLSAQTSDLKAHITSATAAAACSEPSQNSEGASP